MFILLLCMFLMCMMPSLDIASQGILVKFDAVLMLLIRSLVWICSTPHLPLTLSGSNIWKWLKQLSWTRRKSSLHTGKAPTILLLVQIQRFNPSRSSSGSSSVLNFCLDRKHLIWTSNKIVGALPVCWLYFLHLQSKDGDRNVEEWQWSLTLACRDVAVSPVDPVFMICDVAPWLNVPIRVPADTQGWKLKTMPTICWLKCDYVSFFSSFWLHIKTKHFFFSAPNLGFPQNCG